MTMLLMFHNIVHFIVTHQCADDSTDFAILKNQENVDAYEVSMQSMLWLLCMQHCQ